MIRVAYNYQTFTQQKYGGISRIFSEIAPLIDDLDNFEIKVYAGLYQNHYLANSLNIKRKGWQVSYPSKTTRVFLALNPLFAKVAMEIDKPNIVHETYYSSINTVPKGSKTVITVLDMIHEKFVDSMGGKKFLDVKANAIKRADSIICISENTKQDLVELLNIDPAKISVIYLGHTVERYKTVSDEPIMSEPYILYVGLTDLPYKNFERLLRAYAKSVQLQKHFKLVCFGSKSFSKEQLNLIDSMGVNRSNVAHYSGNDSLLANFYRHAAAFIYPSLYEGFGIPPLEAMSFNCPVICSNTSSIPEVVGDAGEYFDPYNVDSICESVEKVVFSSTVSDKLRSKGEERIKHFSWDKCAMETKAVYEKMMHDK
jgi:glycosyltransferase involved in cell wall biosynthesis